MECAKTFSRRHFSCTRPAGVLVCPRRANYYVERLALAKQAKQNSGIAVHAPLGAYCTGYNRRRPVLNQLLRRPRLRTSPRRSWEPGARDSQPALRDTGPLLTEEWTIQDDHLGDCCVFIFLYARGVLWRDSNIMPQRGANGKREKDRKQRGEGAFLYPVRDKQGDSVCD